MGFFAALCQICLIRQITLIQLEPVKHILLRLFYVSHLQLVPRCNGYASPLMISGSNIF